MLGVGQRGIGTPRRPDLANSPLIGISLALNKALGRCKSFSESSVPVFTISQIRKPVGPRNDYIGGLRDRESRRTMG